ncbi:MAG: chromosomal replication initiator protein DnaA [Dehalococcoidia bacterium]|nr:chromosomal replication initiator protein DnaA [Dehalococcoidia bacterium]
MSSRSAKQIWQTALGELQLQVNRANFNTWLKDTSVVSHEDNLFVIGAPTAFAQEWLESRMKSLVKKTLIGIMDQSVDVRFVVAPAKRREKEAIGNANTEAALQQEVFQMTSPVEPKNGNGPVFSLNPKYTFNTFIVGSSNRLAHAAALAAAERLGHSYNPLFIYGGVGLGKTHLMHAIGHLAKRQTAQIIYVSSEQFTNEFINAIRERRNEEFRAKYRSADLLLIDDIQFIAGKEQTQEEFFHTFNDLHSANRQIVVSSDRPPKSLPLLEDRLRSRFEWGLITDIQAPDFETRVAILRSKAEAQGAGVSPAVLDLIAQRVQSNIRELEGFLNRVVAYARLHGLPMTPEVAAVALEEIQAGGGRRKYVSPRHIVETVAGYFHLDLEQLTGPKRDRDIARPRQIAMFIMREETKASLGEIGYQLGGRDHTTILHGYGKIANEINTDARLRREILEIKELVLSSGNGKGDARRSQAEVRAGRN